MITEEFRVAEISVSYRPAISCKPIVVRSQDAYALIKPFFHDDTIGVQESFMVMYLNRANRVLGIYPMATGGITGCIGDIRIILSVALKSLATSIIIAHNHPSGNLKPSRADEDITQKVKAAAALMDIRLADHIILAEGEAFFSFADEGMM